MLAVFVAAFNLVSGVDMFTPCLCSHTDTHTHTSRHRNICVDLAVFLAPGIRAYEQLGYRAFGTPGKMAAGIAITLQNIGGESPVFMH